MVKHINNCYRCLCEVCSNASCPAGRASFVKFGKMDFCLKSIQRKACPRIKCDFFVPKYRKRYFKIARIKKREDAMVDLLKSMKEEIAKLRQNGFGID